jgi:hypothetical protein
MPSPVPPSPADLAAAADRTIPDVLPAAGQPLLVLFSGINPSLIAAHHLRGLGPRVLAIAGVTAYRTAFARPRAAIGPQPDPLGTTPVWVLPNPSGLNASWTLPRLTEAFRELRESLARPHLI